jgi:hypothetical protein
MFAPQDRPLASPAGRSASSCPLPPATGIPPSAKDVPPQAQAPLSSIAGNSRAKSARRALFVRSLAQVQNATPLFSGAGTFFSPHVSRQTLPLQAVAHSLASIKIITSTFPIISRLFVRSCARVQYSTPLLSCACALFCKTTEEGVGVTPNKTSTATSSSPFVAPGSQLQWGFACGLERSPASP